MKTLKILSLFAFALFLVSTVSAVVTTNSYWSTSNNIDDGGSTNFNVTAWSFGYNSMKLNIKLYNLENMNVPVYTFANNQVISNSLCKDSNGNPAPGTTCFYKQYS